MAVSEVILDSVNELMTIFPDPGEEGEIASLLLELADSPRDVKTTMDPGLGFTVPFWLYEKFVETWDIRNGTVIVETIPAGSSKPEKAEIKEFEGDVDDFAAELRAELAADGKDTTELDKFIASRELSQEALKAMEAPETPARRKPGRPRKES